MMVEICPDKAPPSQVYNIKVDETRYTLGVRGIESMVAVRVSGDSEPSVTMGVEYRSFPLYDGHGNMIATLTRTGTGYTRRTGLKARGFWEFRQAEARRAI